MGQIKVIITKYGFNKPETISEDEYISYKQMFSIDPTYSLAPKSMFWNEFSELKWCLITFVSGLLLAAITQVEFFAVISMLSIFFLIMILATGLASSISSYNKFENLKNEYFENLKKIILNSTNYDDFKYKSMKL